MHGELMEFSDMLHRQLNAREALLKLYKQELIQLRGPVSTGLHIAHFSKETICSGDIFALWSKNVSCLRNWDEGAFCHLILRHTNRLR